MNKHFGKLLISAFAAALIAVPSIAQLVDFNKAPNSAYEGIKKTLAEQIGAGTGDVMTPDSSVFIIRRDPFRAIRRGRQLFQRKFTSAEGQGPNFGDGVGDINIDLAIGAGLSDSCAGCHGRRRGSAGSGGTVVTRPDSRDAPHLFGLGLKEMLADETTEELRAIRARVITAAKSQRKSVTADLVAKGIYYGEITARADGSLDTTRVEGVDPDLRIRPFFHHGGTISIREFIVGALKNEMGLEALDSDLARAMAGGKFITPSGMLLDGSTDRIEKPPATEANQDPDGDGVRNEIPESLVDHMEFYLLNYFKPAIHKQTEAAIQGRRLFEKIGCTGCHIPDLQINRDRRVADVETCYDPDRGIFNSLFATAVTMFDSTDDGSGFPSIKSPRLQPFLVRNIFTDLKRHDLGSNFYERAYDGTLRTHFMTTPLWGVGSTAPYGHDGRSISLEDVILRHGGEAQETQDRFARLDEERRGQLIGFLSSLVLFPPDDTASNLDSGNRKAPFFPQFGHGSIRLSVLFNNPKDPE